MTARPRSASSGSNTPNASTSACIDVRLWSVRQAKSRSAAASAYKAGHVRINGGTAKSVRYVSVRGEVRYRVDGFDRLLTITRIPIERVDAPIAHTVYIDSSPPLPSPLDASVAVIRDRGAE